MSEVRIIRYDDGRWCEQQYLGDKLHGTWTVFRANGQKDWERQHFNGRKEGYYRKWDDTGRLIEEQWYHLGELHGVWRTWDATGNEKAVGDFFFGYPREWFEQTVNSDFNKSIKPYYSIEPQDCGTDIQGILAGMARTTVRMHKGTRSVIDLSQPGSFWSHVNILGRNEEWPHYAGSPLFPILQIKCEEIPLADHPLKQFSFVTAFAVGGDTLNELGKDIVVRAYGPEDDVLLLTDTPCEPLEAPSQIQFSEEMQSFPDENDLPPGLRAFIEDTGDKDGVLAQEMKLLSRIGGWPGWLQSGRVSPFGRFAFQVDSLDVEGWNCGDCAIHYFFLDDGRGFVWCQEMC